MVSRLAATRDVLDDVTQLSRPGSSLRLVDPESFTENDAKARLSAP